MTKWNILSEQHKICATKDSMMNACQIAETEGDHIYVQGKDIEASSSNAKTCFHI